MNLHKDLDFGEFTVNSLPYAVDNDAGVGLRPPAYGFVECCVHSIENVPSVAKLIFHVSPGANLCLHTLVPPPDSRVSSKPYALRPVNFVYCSSSVGGHCSRLSAEVCAMAEYL